jgi:hypothetical protein
MHLGHQLRSDGNLPGQNPSGMLLSGTELVRSPLLLSLLLLGSGAQAALLLWPEAATPGVGQWGSAA